MAVAHGGAHQVQAVFLAVLMQAKVGHDGGHHGVAGELPLALELGGADGHDLVAVDGIPLLVHQQAAVGVAVEGDAQIVPAGNNAPGQGLQMGGAAAVVDVDAVRLRVDEVRLKRKRPEQVRRGGAGRAVGAVHQHPQAGQVAVDAAQQMLHIGAVQGVHTVVAAAHGAVHGSRKLRMVQDQVLHTPLHLIGELVALGVEDLDAVVGIGVVGGGDDDTGVRLLLHRQKGHRRGGDGAQGHHVAAYGADTGHQGRFQHIGGNAGVLADGDEGAAALFLRQDGGHRLSHMKCQLRRQGLPRYAADAVGAKEFSHIPILLFVIIPSVPGP